MKKFLLLVVLSLFWLQLFSGPKKVQNFSLDNKMQVILQEIKEFPYINFSVLVKNGGAVDCESEGLPLLTARLLLKGTKKLDAAKLQEQLDLLGARIDASVDEDFTIFSGGVLAKNAPEFFRLLADILFNPALQEDEFQKERNKMIQGLKEVLNSPQALVFNYFKHLFFQGHPASRLFRGTEKSLQQLAPATLKEYYQRVYQPAQLVMSFAGKISRAELQKLIQKNFAALKNSTLSSPAKVSDFELKKSSCYLINKPDTAQAYFVLGFSGKKFGFAGNEEYELFNTVFGGRFTSWLNAELRIKRGLTYGARSQMSSFASGGVFYITSYTKNEQLAEMLTIVQELIKKVNEQGLTQEELLSSKNYLQGQMPRKNESWQAIALNNARLFCYQLPFDYYEQLLKRIDGAGLESVNDFARQLMQNKKYILVVVGKAEILKPALEKFSEFELLEADLNF